MIHWFQQLPQQRMDLSQWTPFIQKPWYRNHFMKFVYLLQIIIVLLPPNIGIGILDINILLMILIGIIVFLLHESLHILVIHKKGDISLTFRGVFFWLNTNAILSKGRFWVFMSLPFIALSIVPVILSFYVFGELKPILLFISWFNTFISASDIINSFLIVIKPKNTVFYRGYFRIKED